MKKSKLLFALLFLMLPLVACGDTCRCNPEKAYFYDDDTCVDWDEFGSRVEMACFPEEGQICGCDGKTYSNYVQRIQLESR